MLRFLGVMTIALGFAGCSRQPAGQPVSTQPIAPVTAQPVAGDNAAPEPQLEPSAVVKSSAPVRQQVQAAQLTIPAGTRLRVRLGESLDTKYSRPGARFVAHLDQPVVDGDHVIIPRGTTFQGHVVDAKSSGRLKGRAYMAVTLDSFQLQGFTYEISTAASGRSSTSHKKRNLLMIGGGSGVGAAIGAIAGGGAGALIGAGAGAAAGTTGAYITGKKNVKLPAETPLTFSLQHPVTVRG